MGSAAVANHALSCPSYVALIQPDTASTSTRSLLHRTGLLVLPRQRKRPLPSSSSSSSSRHNRQRSKQRAWRSRAAAAGHALSESSPDIDVEAMVAEAPGLLALSSDLDWQQSVSELREEAMGGLSARGEREMAIERLGGLMEGWLHDSVVKSVLQPSLVGADSDEELGVRIRVQDLRWQAALQATEELANGVESGFDWESEVTELRQCLVSQQRVAMEQKLLRSWESARLGMDKDAHSLHDEALQIHHSDHSYLTLFPHDSREGEPMEHETSSNKALEISGTWWTLGLLATAGWFGIQNMDAVAADEPITSAVAAAAKDAPSWVAPSVLAFPVVSYFLFSFYRNNVNPSAKLTDWVFGLVAMAILGNIVLIATVGVRLY